MRRDAAIAILSGFLPELRARFGITELSLFGSVARGEATEQSDVDLMVSFETTPSFPAFMELPQSGSDLVTRAGLKPA